MRDRQLLSEMDYEQALADRRWPKRGPALGDAHRARHRPGHGGGRRHPEVRRGRRRRDERRSAVRRRRREHAGHPRRRDRRRMPRLRRSSRCVSRWTRCRGARGRGRFAGSSRRQTRHPAAPGRVRAGAGPGAGTGRRPAISRGCRVDADTRPACSPCRTRRCSPRRRARHSCSRSMVTVSSAGGGDGREPPRLDREWSKGSPPGDLVVASNPASLREGMLVEVTERIAPPRGDRHERRPGPDTSGRRGIAALAIRRPVGTLALTSIVVVLGLFFLQRLPVDLLPEIAYPEIRVTVDYPGTAPEVMEQQVTRVLERNLAGTENLVSLQSRASEGVTHVTCTSRSAPTWTSRCRTPRGCSSARARSCRATSSRRASARSIRARCRSSRPASAPRRDRRSRCVTGSSSSCRRSSWPFPAWAPWR
jgi:hypothetical protein